MGVPLRRQNGGHPRTVVDCLGEAIADGAHRTPGSRRVLTRLISEGRFANRLELNAHVQSIGLGQTRNGTDYITVVTEAKERVRLYLPQELRTGLLDEPGRHKRRDEAWTFTPGLRPDSKAGVFSVYVIVAVAPTGEMAAYVGSTSLLQHRLAEHFHGRDGTSVDLADWARRHRARAYTNEVMCTNDRGGAIQLEGCYTAELESRGWLLPGVTRWGAARRTAAMMTKSFRNGNITWSEPVAEDVQTWTPISAFKFYA